MTADPAILKRIRGCPFARGGRLLVRFRANGDCLFARRVLWPSRRGGWQPPGDFGAVAMPLDLALQSLITNPYFLDLRQTYS